MSRGKGRTELVKPEVIWIQSGFLGIPLESTEHVDVVSSAGRAEDQRLGGYLVGLQVDQLRTGLLVGDELSRYAEVARTTDSCGKRQTLARSSSDLGPNHPKESTCTNYLR